MARSDENNRSPALRRYPQWFWPWVAFISIATAMLLWMSGLIIFTHHYRMTDVDRILFFIDAIGLSVGLPVGVNSKQRWDRQHPMTAGGLCRTCGYDLRASTDRCPECGEAIVR